MMTTANIATLVDVKTAVRAAVKYFQDLQDVFSGVSLQYRDLRLEEVELSEDESIWLVTLSFGVPEDAIGMKLHREYKIFVVDSKNAEVRSMKIREL
jgi:hypothetical protein